MFFFIDSSKCTNCNLCIETCKSNGLDIIQIGKDGKPVINIFFNVEVKGKSYIARTGKGCNKCQDCTLICPEEAISTLNSKNASDDVISDIYNNLDTSDKNVLDKIKCTKENIAEYIGF